MIYDTTNYKVSTTNCQSIKGTQNVAENQ